MIIMNEILKDKELILFKNEIIFEGYTAIGYFPYSTKRISGNKISRALFTHIESQCVKDNKVVVLFKDTTNFGTHNFAIFFHDYGSILGKWSDIINY
jgi:hypothetical protein